MALYLGPDSAIILNNGLFQGAKPGDTLPGVRFVTTTANAPGDLVGPDAVVPVLAQNWVSTFSGAGAIAIAQAFPPADPPTSPPNLADVAFDHFIQASGSNDRIALEAGNSWIEAGAGFDVVSVAGGFRGAETSLIDDGSLRLDLRSQTALLRNVEEVDFVDGRLHLSMDSAAAQVSRLYDAALGREPEQAGLNFWIDRLEAGQPLLTLANGFLDSAEFGYRYGHPSNQDYVALLYQNVLGRAPDPGGEATWTAALAAGTSRASVLIGFSESPENKRAHAAEDAVGIWDVDENAAFVALLYDAALNRLPDVSGLASWRAALDAGQFTKATMTAAFTESGEYHALYGGLGNQQFVQALYINALNRPADPGGLATWTGLLDKGVSRAEVIQAISESAEHVAITKPFIMSDAPDHFGIAFA